MKSFCYFCKIFTDWRSTLTKQHDHKFRSAPTRIFAMCDSQIHDIFVEYVRFRALRVDTCDTSHCMSLDDPINSHRYAVRPTRRQSSTQIIKITTKKSSRTLNNSLNWNDESCWMSCRINMNERTNYSVCQLSVCTINSQQNETEYAENVLKQSKQDRRSNVCFVLNEINTLITSIKTEMSL